MNKLDQDKIYFDYAAATPMSSAVLEAMKPFFTDRFYNPSALYLDAQDNQQALSVARSDVARILGVKSSEIIFVAGGTESTNLAIHGVMQANEGANVVISAIEHEAVVKPAECYDHRLANVGQTGLVDELDLANKIDDDTVLVSLMYANNEIGTIQPIRNIAKLINQIRHDRSSRLGIDKARPLYFHTDACQATNHLSLLISSLGVDMMTLNGGKIYGPKQSGILYIKTGTVIKPQILGGGQERGLRSGTENLANAVGFAKALTETVEVSKQETDRLTELRNMIETGLLTIGRRIEINGDKNRLANNLSFTVPGIDNERLLMELDERAIMVATGSACSASSGLPSYVLQALGKDDEYAHSTIRLSLGRASNEEQVTRFLLVLRELLS